MNTLKKQRLAMAVALVAMVGVSCSAKPTDPQKDAAGRRMVGAWQDKAVVNERYRAYLLLRADGSFLSRQVVSFPNGNKTLYMDNVGKYSLAPDGKTVNYYDMGRQEGLDCSAFTSSQGVNVNSGLAVVGQELRLDFTDAMAKKFGSRFPAIQSYEPIGELPPLPAGAEPRCHPIVTI